jgi:hypothetical protein
VRPQDIKRCSGHLSRVDGPRGLDANIMGPAGQAPSVSVLEPCFYIEVDEWRKASRGWQAATRASCGYAETRTARGEWKPD